jgi:hypothetical protein
LSSARAAAGGGARGEAESPRSVVPMHRKCAAKSQ